MRQSSPTFLECLQFLLAVFRTVNVTPSQAYDALIPLPSVLSRFLAPPFCRERAHMLHCRISFKFHGGSDPVEGGSIQGTSAVMGMPVKLDYVFIRAFRPLIDLILGTLGRE
ncbi:hypothetical protein EDB89DRAFT_2009363 [Lactarius sanguifluus]|nr:hypothetical protein EDB89DRAFT_2009363 [Lactarius sanguifluus]